MVHCQPMRLFTSLLSFILLVSTAGNYSAISEDLFKDIEEDLHIGDATHSKKIIKEAYTARWFEPGSNFSKIFISRQGPKLLNEWVGAKALGYHVHKSSEIREEDYAGTRSIILSNTSKVSLKMTIYVPHPRSAEAREFNVIKAFTLFEPPSFIPKEIEKINAAGLKGTAYFKDTEISVLFHLDKGAVLNLETDKKFGLNELQKYANQLNFERLNSKLGS
jgi:hypothetical protein